MPIVSPFKPTRTYRRLRTPAMWGISARVCHNSSFPVHCTPLGAEGNPRCVYFPEMDSNSISKIRVEPPGIPGRP
jgi:hypothetical protein